MTDELNNNYIKSSIFSPLHWTRLIYMLLFALMLHVASIAMWVLCAMQFLFALFTDRDNVNLRFLGKSITLFIGQALDFLTYNTETKPFPFAEWPVEETRDSGATSLVAVEQAGGDEKGADSDTSGETGQSTETDQSDQSGPAQKPGE